MLFSCVVSTYYWDAMLYFLVNAKDQMLSVKCFASWQLCNCLGSWFVSSVVGRGWEGRRQQHPVILRPEPCTSEVRKVCYKCCAVRFLHFILNKEEPQESSGVYLVLNLCSVLGNAPIPKKKKKKRKPLCSFAVISLIPRGPIPRVLFELHCREENCSC